MPACCCTCLPAAVFLWLQRRFPACSRYTKSRLGTPMKPHVPRLPASPAAWEAATGAAQTCSAPPRALQQIWATQGSMYRLAHLAGKKMETKHAALTVQAEHCRQPRWLWRQRHDVSSCHVALRCSRAPDGGPRVRPDLRIRSGIGHKAAVHGCCQDLERWQRCAQRHNVAERSIASGWLSPPDGDTCMRAANQ